ncbi:MAG: hypothetical protein V3T86_09145 [Planctomycetota bacterium]
MTALTLNALLALETTHLRWHSLPALWVLVLVIVPVTFLLVRAVYRREAGRVGRRPRMLMGVLRSAAILLVLVALFGPYAETIIGEPLKRHLILCVDTSRSMSFRDSYQDAERADEIAKAVGLEPGVHPSERSRLALVKGLFRAHPEFLAELADKFNLHLFTFDGALAPLTQPRNGESAVDAVQRLRRELNAVEASGPVTRVGVAIRDLVRSFSARNEPVAGVIMFTDGRHTGGEPLPIEEARRAKQGTRDGMPFFPVGIGDWNAAHNVGVAHVDAPEVVLAGDDVVFTVNVYARGYEGRTAEVEAHIIDGGSGDGGEPSILSTPAIDADPFILPPAKNARGERETVEVTFRLRFDEPGRYNMKVGVPRQPGEAGIADNFQPHTLLVVTEKLRVLFASGKPQWGQRYLKEMLLRAEDTIEANIILFSAEPNWPQEASDGLRPIKEFPQTRAELAEYDVVILQDLSRAYLGGDVGPDAVLEMLEDWVSEGGGLVLQAGKDHIPAGYAGTRLMTLMPVVPGIAGRLTVNEQQHKRYKLTAAGQTHPLMRILSIPPREFWDGDDYATTYCWYSPVERAKSSATVLAYRRDKGHAGHDSEPHALFAIQEFGSGKVLWLGTDELWRMRDSVENLYLWPFWSDIIRHLATYRLLGGNRRTKIFLDRNDGRYRVGDSIEIEAKYLDENFEPVVPQDGDPASQRRALKLRAPNGTERDIELTAVPEEPPRGIFQARIIAGKPGTYLLYAEPERDEEPAQRSFVVEETTLEMRDPLLDRKSLLQIANASGGELLTPAQFLEIVSTGKIELGGTIRTGERHRTELWDRSWVLLLFTALLAAEWILRKKNLLL